MRVIYFILVFQAFLFPNSVFCLSVTINDEEIPLPAQKLKSHLKKYTPSSLLEMEPDRGLIIPIRQGFTIQESILKKEKQPNDGLRLNRHKSQVGKVLSGESRIYSTLSKLRNSMFNSKDNSINDDGIESSDDFEQEEAIDNPATPTTSSSMPESGTSLSNPPTSTKLASKKSWVKEFLKFKHNKNLEKQQHQLTIHQQNVGGSSRLSNRKLKSKIYNYHDTMSTDNRNLKEWTKLIVEQDHLESNLQDSQLQDINKFKDVNYKKFGSSQKLTNLQSHDNLYASQMTKSKIKEIELDVDEFINYLIDYEGFKRDDLEFLKSSNLDYGLKEIERELNKLKELEQNNEINFIKIGGEIPLETDDTNGNAENLGINSQDVYYNSYIYLILLLLMIL